MKSLLLNCEIALHRLEAFVQTLLMEMIQIIGVV
jgi:hypothetical protein